MRIAFASLLLALCGVSAVYSQPPAPAPAPLPPAPTVWLVTPAGGAQLPAGGFAANGMYANLNNATDTLVFSLYAADGYCLCSTPVDWGGGFWCCTAPGFNCVYEGKGYAEIAIVRKGVPSWADTNGVSFK